jgi:predicted RNA-binding Zn-ribbon protein involved in translation (DUF1610 family)
LGNPRRDTYSKRMSDDDSDPGFDALPEEADYVCPACGEVIVVPLDASAGRDQDYVEDCPVCCCPNHLFITRRPDGTVDVRCEAE